MYEYVENKLAYPTDVKVIVNGPAGQVLAGPHYIQRNDTVLNRTKHKYLNGVTMQHQLVVYY